MPVQDYPPQDKVCDYHEKTGSSSPIAKDCQACWRGGPPLISCREMLNADAHLPPYTHTHIHTQGNTMTQMHIATCTLMLIHMHVLTNAICSSCAGIHNSLLYKNSTIINFSEFYANVGLFFFFFFLVKILYVNVHEG